MGKQELKNQFDEFVILLCEEKNTTGKAIFPSDLLNRGCVGICDSCKHVNRDSPYNRTCRLKTWVVLLDLQLVTNS